MRIILIFFILFLSVNAERIKDVSNIVGIRDNQLIGYGLVVGLAGTGDKSQFTMQSLQNLLRNSYIKIPTSSIKSKNIAAVMVTASLPPFSRQGDKIKVKISAIGDAKSIDKGVLLLTQLKGVDGEVYALSQGSIVAQEDNPTTGFIFNGATIENEIEFSLKDEKYITLSLIKNSAKIADTIERKINEKFNEKIAFAYDTRTIEVRRPLNMSMVRFISIVENIPIDTNIKKKIIIDMSREMIIAGENIVVKPVTVAREGYAIKIKKSALNDEDWKKADKNPGVDIGEDVKVGNKPVKVDINNALVNTKREPTISDVVRAMKIMQLPIGDIIETIKIMKDLNAIDADLEIRG